MYLCIQALFLFIFYVDGCGPIFSCCGSRALCAASHSDPLLFYRRFCITHRCGWFCCVSFRSGNNFDAGDNVLGSTRNGLRVSLECIF